MIHDVNVALAPEAVIQRAKTFFSERVPHAAAFVEKEGPRFLTLRGQGGEEIALAAMPAEGGSRVRASTYLFDQQVDRFLSTLPLSGPVSVT